MNFAELHQKYESMIYKIMHQLNIYKNQDEFYQIGLIALWDASKNFDKTKGNFANYAYMYIKGRMMTELTRQNKWAKKIFYPDEEFWKYIEDTAGSEIPLELETLLSYCDRLTNRERQWVVYHFYYGWNSSQIAKLENVTIHAVRKWRHQALSKLRRNCQK